MGIEGMTIGVHGETQLAPSPFEFQDPRFPALLAASRQFPRPLRLSSRLPPNIFHNAESKPLILEHPVKVILFSFSPREKVRMGNGGSRTPTRQEIWL